MKLPHGPKMDLREVLREHLAVQCPNRSSDWHSFAFANPERQTCFQPSIRVSDDRQTTNDKSGDLNPTQWPNARCAGLATSKAKFRTNQDLNHELDKIFKARNFIDSQKSLSRQKRQKQGLGTKSVQKSSRSKFFCAVFSRFAGISLGTRAAHPVVFEKRRAAFPLSLRPPRDR
jgi:hypothetical protein